MPWHPRVLAGELENKCRKADGKIVRRKEILLGAAIAAVKQLGCEND